MLNLSIYHLTVVDSKLITYGDNYGFVVIARSHAQARQLASTDRTLSSNNTSIWLDASKTYCKRIGETNEQTERVVLVANIGA